MEVLYQPAGYMMPPGAHSSGTDVSPVNIRTRSSRVKLLKSYFHLLSAISFYLCMRNSLPPQNSTSSTDISLVELVNLYCLVRWRQKKRARTLPFQQVKLVEMKERHHLCRSGNFFLSKSNPQHDLRNSVVKNFVASVDSGSCCFIYYTHVVSRPGKGTR